MQPQEPEPFDSSFFSEIEERSCPCHGTGWIDHPGWEECAIHYAGQLHPESYELLMDDPIALLEAERTSILKWKIENGRKKAAELAKELRQVQINLTNWELELINKTPTIKMEAVKVPDGF